MFQFLQPILLFSFAALAIPVIIHLWNIQQGKTLKIGSISLLTVGSRQSARRLNLNELLLLVLRCLLLTLLALLLAQPIWKQQLSAKKEKGWILLEKESLREGYNNNKPEIDSLIKAGFEFHYFNTSFKKDDLRKALQFQKDTFSPSPPSYWSLLSQLNEQVPASLPVYLFTDAKLNRFTDKRPSISLNLHWQTYVPADSVSTWAEKAFLTSSDSVHLITGHSTPSGTFYNHQNLSLVQVENSAYTVNINDGKLMVFSKANEAVKPGNNAAIEVDTSTIKITVVADKPSNDANYIWAAITAIQRFSKRKIQLSSTNNFKLISAKQDWIFWLLEQAIPSLSDTKNIFQYETGKAENIHSVIRFGDISSGENFVSISKKIFHNDANNLEETIWQDGFGNVVLSKEVKNAVAVFHFCSRFDPEWNGLPWNAEFPKLLFELILKEEKDNAVYHDKRIIDKKQRQVAVADKGNPIKDKVTETRELSHIFWILAFVIFVIERWLTFKTKKVVINARV